MFTPYTKHHFLNHDGCHLDLSRWPKIESVCNLCGMTSLIKFEGNCDNDSKDIAFTRGVYTCSIHF